MQNTREQLRKTQKNVEKQRNTLGEHRETVKNTEKYKKTFKKRGFFEKFFNFFN